MTETLTVRNQPDLPKDLLATYEELKEACEAGDAQNFIDALMMIKLTMPHKNSLRSVPRAMIRKRFKELKGLIEAIQILPGLEELISKDIRVLNKLKETQGMLETREEAMKIMIEPI